MKNGNEGFFDGLWMVIVDYNLTRVDDVRMMVNYAKQRHGLKSVVERSVSGDERQRRRSIASGNIPAGLLIGGRCVCHAHTNRDLTVRQSRHAVRETHGGQREPVVRNQ